MSQEQGSVYQMSNLIEKKISVTCIKAFDIPSCVFDRSKNISKERERMELVKSLVLGTC